jgi:hypothetical protein
VCELGHRAALVWIRITQVRTCLCGDFRHAVGQGTCMDGALVDALHVRVQELSRVRGARGSRCTAVLASIRHLEHV